MSSRKKLGNREWGAEDKSKPAALTPKAAAPALSKRCVRPCGQSGMADESTFVQWERQSGVKTPHSIGAALHQAVGAGAEEL